MSPSPKEFTVTVPARSARAARMARLPLAVKTEAARPYSVSLAMSTASLRLSTGMTARIGPKISSRAGTLVVAGELDDRRVDVAVRADLAAVQHLLAVAEEGADLAEVVVGDQRPDAVGGVERVADLPLLERRLQVLRPARP